MEPTKLLRLHQEVYRGIVQTSEKAKKPAPPPPKIDEKQLSWLEDNKIVQEQNEIKKALKRKTQDDLERIKVLGEGQFGEVWLVETEFPGVVSPAIKGKHQFALKIQQTYDDQREEGAEEDIRAEIEVMGKLSHPFISTLFTYWENEGSIDMLLGLMPGGELWDVIHKEDPETGEWYSGLPESHARFYAMVIADTLGYMHAQKFIFRDLKPENVLLDKDGYPIIIDFGFCKKVEDKTYTFCGTPNYVAPEIIRNAGHNAAVDWWAYGIVIYEMVSGENPFYYDGLDDVSLFNAICEEEGEPLKDCFSRHVRKLVSKLLVKDPTKRLGMLKGRAQDILDHEWFHGINLKKLRAKKIKAPWIPGQEDNEEEKEDSEAELQREQKIEEEKQREVRRQKVEAKMMEFRELELEEQRRRDEAIRRQKENEERQKQLELEREAQRRRQEEEKAEKYRQLEFEAKQRREEEERKQEAVRIKARQEAQAKAEAEAAARIKAQQEAQAKAEAEEAARIKAEKEAKAKTKREAATKAKAEKETARIRAEEERERRRLEKIRLEEEEKDRLAAEKRRRQRMEEEEFEIQREREKRQQEKEELLRQHAEEERKRKEAEEKARAEKKNKAAKEQGDSSFSNNSEEGELNLEDLEREREQKKSDGGWGSNSWKNNRSAPTLAAWNPSSSPTKNRRRSVEDITSPGKGYVNKLVKDGLKSPGGSSVRRKDLEEVSKLTPSGIVAKRLSDAKKKELNSSVPSLFQF
jgi:protein kinase A